MPIFEVTFAGQMYGQTWNNVCHFNSGEGAVSPQEVAAVLNSEWVDQMKTFQTNDVKWFTIQVKKISAGPQEQFTLAINKFGGQAGEPQSNTFVAGVIQKHTGLAGRKFRGRIYVPGIRRGGTSLGIFQDFELTNWNNICGQLMTRFCDPASTGLRLIIHGEGESHDTPVVQLAMRPIIGVMRTRNIGVGN